MIDQILGAEGSYVVIVKAMRTSVVATMKQCLLMLRDAIDITKFTNLLQLCDLANA